MSSYSRRHFSLLSALLNHTCQILQHTLYATVNSRSLRVFHIYKLFSKCVSLVLYLIDTVLCVFLSVL